MNNIETKYNLQISVPLEFKEYEKELTKNELATKAMMLYPLIANEVISHGKAAEILGIDKLRLIQLYGEYDIPYLNQEYDEIEEEERVYNEKFEHR